jgi:predicted RNA-binding protein YlxR (DUF448 family)
MNPKKKVPMRKCVATGEMKPKKELVRIVRSKEGDVSIDLTGKKIRKRCLPFKRQGSCLTCQEKKYPI